jgi:hypothetical protein
MEDIAGKKHILRFYDYLKRKMLAKKFCDM